MLLTIMKYATPNYLAEQCGRTTCLSNSPPQQHSVATLLLAQVLWFLLGGNAGAMIGFGTILNNGCRIDHGCVLGECVQISPDARLPRQYVLTACAGSALVRA